MEPGASDNQMAFSGCFVIGQTEPTRNGLINGWAHCVLLWKTSGTARLWPRESFREMSCPFSFWA